MNVAFKIIGLFFTVIINLYPCNASSLDVFLDKSGNLDIAGGTAHIPVMKQAAKNIMEVNPNIIITIAGGGTGSGIQKVGEGLVQIGNTGRALKDEEIRKYGLVSFPFAIDGVAIIVHPENPVRGLTTKQVQDIFSGKIISWDQVGGKKLPIHLYVREDGSGTRDVFEDQAIRGIHGSSNVNVLHSNGAMKMAVKKDRNAIGYIGIGYVDASIKALVFDNVYPSQKNTAQGKYRVSRFLYMNTKGKPQGLTKLFIDYIYSFEGKNIVIKAGYIPLESN